MDYKKKVRRLRQAGPRKVFRMLQGRTRKKLVNSPVIRRFVRSAPETADEFLALLGLKDEGVAGFVRYMASALQTSHVLDGAEETAALCQRLFPEEAAATLARAEAVCRHRFHFLGRDAHFDGAVDWFWCPETGGSWPFLDVALERDVYETRNKPGDIKYPWELNRHQHFVTLGKAWLYTGDEKYARECVEQLIDWRLRNPYGRGQNWVPMMELGIRCITWTNTLWLFRNSPYFQEHGLLPLVHGIHQHARRLYTQMSDDWLFHNNHIIGESAGLFAAATLLPFLPGADAWRAKALHIFTREILDQVFPDGVNAEQSTTYHRFVLDFALLVQELARRNGRPVPGPLHDRIAQMLEYQYQMTPDDGLAFPLGDSDDGRGYILADSVEFLDFRGWLAVGAVQFGRPAYAAVAGAKNAEALWFLGARRWPLLGDVPHGADERRTTHFAEGGMASLRVAAGGAAVSVYFRCGPFGFGGDGACTHSHGDLLAPLIYWKGEALGVDTGTYAYYCERSIRDYARSAHAHNVFMAQDTEMAHMYPVWDWDDVPYVSIEAFRADSSYAHASFALKRRNVYRWRRAFTLDGPSSSLSIEDNYSDERGRQTPLLWRMHLHDSVAPSISGEGVRLTLPSGRALSLSFSGFERAEIAETWRSPAYGVRRPNKCIVLHASGPQAAVQCVLTEI